MNPTTLAVVLLVVGAIVFLIVQDWFNGYIQSANPLAPPKSSGSAH